jgi:hypothetical protein
MNIGNAFSFVFEDEEWVSKILVGALITLIPIFGGFALMGYGIAVVRNVKSGSTRPLPDWNDLGGYFMDGLMFWLVNLIYSLPILILMCPIALVWILPAVAGEQEDLTAALTGVAGVLSAGLGCLAVLYGILLGLLTPVLQIRYAEFGEIGACLRLGEVFRFLTAHIGGVVISQVILLVVGAVVGSVVGGMATFLGMIPICGWIVAVALGLLMVPVSVWLTVFAGHMYGHVGWQAEVPPTSMI